MLYTALMGFSYEDSNGDNVVVQAGAVVEDGHPMLKIRPDVFVPIVVHFPRPSRVEQATAAPGEQRRGPGRPKNKAGG